MVVLFFHNVPTKKMMKKKNINKRKKKKTVLFSAHWYVKYKIVIFAVHAKNPKKLPYFGSGHHPPVGDQTYFGNGNLLPPPIFVCLKIKNAKAHSNWKTTNIEIWGRKMERNLYLISFSALLIGLGITINDFLIEKKIQKEKRKKEKERKEIQINNEIKVNNSSSSSLLPPPSPSSFNLNLFLF